jgi:hypothetical protein
MTSEYQFLTEFQLNKKPQKNGSDKKPDKRQKVIFIKTLISNKQKRKPKYLKYLEYF